MLVPVGASHARIVYAPNAHLFAARIVTLAGQLAHAPSVSDRSQERAVLGGIDRMQDGEVPTRANRGNEIIRQLCSGSGPMREFKTRREISDWITVRLRGFPDCADATVTVQYELQEPGPDGCNWSHDLILNYGRSDSQMVLQQMRPLHQEASRLFNVREP
jgi:hypothetical protein